VADITSTHLLVPNHYSLTKPSSLRTLPWVS
jgi:hypothetical protein